MRKLFGTYFIVTFLIYFIGLFVAMYYEAYALVWILAGGAAFALIMMLPLGDKKWFMTYEDMVKNQKESIRKIRNATKLVDKVKRNAFFKDIISEDEANEILTRTYEETQMDK